MISHIGKRRAHRNDNLQKLKLYPLKKDLSNTYEPNPIPYPHKGKDGMGTREIYREIILKNTDYDIRCQDPRVNSEQLDEITELIVETVCTARKTIHISGNKFPTEVVKSQFLKLDASHIQYVMECMNGNTTYIRNIKKYLLLPCTMHLSPSTATIPP